MKTYRQQFKRELENYPVNLIRSNPDHYIDRLVNELVELLDSTKYRWLKILLKIGQIVAKIWLISEAKYAQKRRVR